MHTTWILVADSSRARIFSRDRDEDGFHEVQDFANPAGHARDSDLETDNLGRFRSKGEGQPGSTAEPATDPVEHEIEMFSKSLGDFLDKACAEHRYEKLRVIAAPRFLGHIRKHLGNSTRQHVEDEIPKDFSWYETGQIESLLNDLPIRPQH